VDGRKFLILLREMCKVLNLLKKMNKEKNDKQRGYPPRTPVALQKALNSKSVSVEHLDTLKFTSSVK